MLIYICGPVTDMPKHNLPAFEDAANKLRDAGYRPLVPHYFVPKASTWVQAMKRSIETLLRADGVAMLDGHEHSKGAAIEMCLAFDLQMPVKPLDEWL